MSAGEVEKIFQESASGIDSSGLLFAICISLNTEDN